MSKCKKKISIDIGLTALCNAAEPGQTLLLIDIADVCECQRQTIFHIQESALKKLRKAINFNDHLEE